jgi:hypothetical protein
MGEDWGGGVFPAGAGLSHFWDSDGRRNFGHPVAGTLSVGALALPIVILPAKQWPGTLSASRPDAYQLDDTKSKSKGNTSYKKFGKKVASGHEMGCLFAVSGLRLSCLTLLRRYKGNKIQIVIH